MSRHNTPERSRASAGSIVGLVLLLLIILAATLTPSDPGQPEELERCVLCGERWMADLVRNIVLFVPFGAMLALVMRASPAYRTILTASLASALIELAQLSIPGRDPSIGDLLANTIGGIIGVVAVRTARRWMTPSRRSAGRLSLAAAAIIAGVLVVTGLLWRPSLPASTYFVQWTPDLEHLEPYGGRVLTSSLGDAPLVPDERPGPERLAGFLDGSDELIVHAEAGPPPTSLAPILAIHDQHEREIILIGPDRDDMVFRFRTRGVAIAFDQPDLRVHGAMSGVRPGAPLSLRLRRAGIGNYCIGVGSRSECGHRFAAGSGWAALLFPRIRTESVQRTLDAIWLGLLVLPVGLWLRRSAWSAGAVGLVTAALAAVPPLTGLQPVTLTELAGVGAGIALGAGIARRAFATLPDEDTTTRIGSSSPGR